MTFDDFKLNKQLLQAVADLGYEIPTPIQEKAIPLALAGHDLFGIAQTGTGKTAAYTLPLLMKLKYAQGESPRALVLAPTRELSIQIGKAIEEFSVNTDLRCTTVYGGIGPKKQMEEIAEGIDILVGTPGRVLDIYFKDGVFLRDIKYMVLDEADRMMDMGFMPQINQLLEIIPAKRQNLLFSATMPDKVIRLSEDFLEFPMRAEVTPQATTAETIKQELIYVPNFLTKINMLQHLVLSDEMSKTIIFTRNKRNADNIFKFLNRKMEGGARVLHANKGQNARLNSIDAFSNDEVRFLVATDVASRGLDISDVSHVINFDVPVMYDDYVHRVGRTGRANKSGIAITFCNDAEKYHIKRIQKLIQMDIPISPMPLDVEIAETEFEERQEMLKEIDRQKKRENPDFKGAFHEKKKKSDEKKAKTTSRPRPPFAKSKKHGGGPKPKRRRR